MSNIAIRVEGLGKQYRIGGAQKSFKTLREVIVDSFNAPLRRARQLLRGQAYGAAGLDESIWALKDVSFEVKHGEVVGIIGRNGAGKSTLLKILSRITEPTEGEVRLRGRVGALLEVGTGFHSELTGRENVYLNGAILGMTRADINKKFDEIVAFAGVEKFIDTPVKFYSSGMGLRLGFAVAAHLEPDILVVDEVLAVGDAEFQKKCIGKMSDVAGEGRTVLFVSHNMTMIENLCEYGILLDHGRIVVNDTVQTAVRKYVSAAHDTSATVDLSMRDDRSGDGAIRITKAQIGLDDDPGVGYWVTGEDAIVQLDYVCRDGGPYRNVEVAIGLRTLDQIPLLYLGTKVVRYSIDELSGTGHFVCRIPRLPLEANQYSITVEVMHSSVIADLVVSALSCTVAEGDFYGTGVIWGYGNFLCDYSWSHHPEPNPTED